MRQCVGDALGSMVEGMPAEDICRQYPDGLRHMADGGVWDTLAGQPTDDTETAILLARDLAERGSYDLAAVKVAYLYWMGTKPFCCGATICSAFNGELRPESQGNGAMMRASPFAILFARHGPNRVSDWTRQDAALTHPIQSVWIRMSSCQSVGVCRKRCGGDSDTNAAVVGALLGSMAWEPTSNGLKLS